MNPVFSRYDIILGLLVIALFVLETVIPFKSSILSRWVHIRRNVVVSLISQGAALALTVVLIMPAFRWVEGGGVGLQAWLPWPGLIGPVFVFLAFDFWIYWWHRLNHRFSLLWKFHRMHHSDPLLDFSSAFRFHPGEIIISTGLNALVIIALGMTLRQFLAYKIFFHAVVLFHHSNIAVPQRLDRWLMAVVVTPAMHRLHHSTDWAESNSNFASLFSFWDRLSQTFRKREFLDIEYGLDRFMEEEWQQVKGLLRVPFAPR